MRRTLSRQTSKISQNSANNAIDANDNKGQEIRGRTTEKNRSNMVSFQEGSPTHPIEKALKEAVTTVSIKREGSLNSISTDSNDSTNSISRQASFEDEKNMKPSVNISVDSLNIYFKLAEKLGLSNGYDMIDLRNKNKEFNEIDIMILEDIRSKQHHVYLNKLKIEEELRIAEAQAVAEAEAKEILAAEIKEKKRQDNIKKKKQGDLARGKSPNKGRRGESMDNSSRASSPAKAVSRGRSPPKSLRPTTGSTVGSQAVPKDTNRRATTSKIDVKNIKGVRAVSTDQNKRPTTGSATTTARSVSTSKDKKEVRAVSTDKNVRPVSTDHNKSSLNPDKKIKKTESKSEGDLLENPKDKKPLT
eukprot:CAMPEP_0119046444 /NCGR_PEP_ID=MMETSP1177-20130426/46615_1 /TAXON_ID=2985 /ORGANISM="Ochromonas sp, Strain CCMP1899" /LENGTH=359 /DNA_ID=CAMNT_0007019597 /DNA_START=195 /DNA_END=1271 /DNA_ORIENTATION=+